MKSCSSTLINSGLKAKWKRQSDIILDYEKCFNTLSAAEKQENCITRYGEPGGEPGTYSIGSSSTCTEKDNFSITGEPQPERDRLHSILKQLHHRGNVWTIHRSWQGHTMA